ncbi:MAG: Gfo/Idh/MocA family oxidoreductase [Fimbriimonadaceae bacterium]|nr:Gfo/Idh/MocA family oxidoreductase [Fimbriimonadaceae bacterium]
MKIAVAGAGFWTRFQLHGWRTIPDPPEIVAIWNRTPERAESLAAEFGIPQVFTDLEAMLEQAHPDVLDVITAVEHHRTAALAGLNRGIHVICQKPMAESLAECREMSEAADRSAGRLLIHENWRWQAPILEVVRLFEEGALGPAHRARLNFSTSFPVFDNQPFLAQIDRFILTDIGSHILDVARRLFGEARSLHCLHTRVNDIRGEDVATVTMEMDRCPIVTCDMSYASPLADESFPETYITIECRDGSIELRKGGRILVTTRQGTTESLIVPTLHPWADPAYAQVHDSIVACCTDLARALRSGGPCGTEGHENLKTMELVFASYLSAESGRTVIPRETP